MAYTKSLTKPYRRQPLSDHSERGQQDVVGTGFEAVVPNPKLKLMDQVREVMRLTAVEGGGEDQTPSRRHRSLSLRLNCSVGA